ncbi:MAG: 3-ketoacyl-CoA thiolase [Euryarchaeota archaeon]|nr:3-ketoacyl-CoA thiolase [Euryarchaeota archaeon]MDE1835691.1 3-ketoacyl-CoA thiolase [Euryarchaeota archaeon]MDE1880447.1 3-ketoacyl-CoA thiolase [Euryarchaeota archaeon]MDE2043881.1 3-ketoacyl-CoA thiolase [Thermoplasmata archaeon]
MSATRRVAVVAGGLSSFGVRSATWSELVQEAGHAAFGNIRNFSSKDVDSLFVGAAQPERLAFQSHVAPLAAELLGFEPWKILQRTELACASGQSAIRSAYAAISAGLSDVAAVVGVEKMNLPSMAEANTSMANVLDRAWDGVHGATAPPFFAMCAQRHMLEYGTTAEQMAMVSEKNHRFANTNPSAQFYSKQFSRDKLLKLPMVAPPLRLGDCSSMTDGAAGVLLVAEELARKYTDTPVWIRGTGQHSSFHNLSGAGSLSTWPGLKAAAQEAFRSAKLAPQDLDLAEVHDCFTISEIIEYEEIGFCAKGEGGTFVQEGQSDLGGKVVVNPRGGLLGCGHPLGATGVAQAVEVFQQLQGSAPPARQVPGAELALVHNLSGSANVHSLMIYGREN